MYSPSLQYLLAQAHAKELHRSGSAEPITTNERIAARGRAGATLPSYLAHVIERFVGHPAPEAYAF